MYSYVSTIERKEQILSTFLCRNNILNPIIITTSFSMRIDCPDITTIMHCGIPSTFEEYVQETRRAGPDGSNQRQLFFMGKVKAFQPFFFFFTDMGKRVTDLLEEPRITTFGFSEWLSKLSGAMQWLCWGLGHLLLLAFFYCAFKKTALSLVNYYYYCYYTLYIVLFIFLIYYYCYKI